jgi:hypothetical protein
MKFHFFGLTITITNKAIIVFTALAIAFVVLLPNNSADLYSDYSMWLSVVFAVLFGIASILFVEVEGDII